MVSLGSFQLHLSSIWLLFIILWLVPSSSWISFILMGVSGCGMEYLIGSNDDSRLPIVNDVISLSRSLNGVTSRSIILSYWNWDFFEWFPLWRVILILSLLYGFVCWWWCFLCLGARVEGMTSCWISLGSSDCRVEGCLIYVVIMTMFESWGVELFRIQLLLGSGLVMT